jgi:hypothetical protein
MTRPDPGKPRLFYKTTVKYVVLSEEPIPPQISLAGLHNECYEGHYVGSFGETEEVLVNGAVMVDELREAGSCPDFFELDDEGNDLPERDFDFEKFPDEPDPNGR